MSEELKYKIGDEILIRAKITDIDKDDDDNPYLADDGNGLESWISEASIVSTEAGDAPIEPGVWVRAKTGATVPGKVIAIRKGFAWVDWNPSSEDDTNVSSRQINLLVRLTEKEVRQLAGV